MFKADEGHYAGRLFKVGVRLDGKLTRMFSARTVEEARTKALFCAGSLNRKAAFLIRQSKLIDRQRRIEKARTDCRRKLKDIEIKLAQID